MSSFPLDHADPGGVFTLPLCEYIADPAPVPSLSASIANTILTKSARHAWTQHPRLNPDYEPEHSSRCDFGTIMHALLLENDTSKVVIIEADDWRTKLAKQQRDDAREAGMQPVLAKDMETIRAMSAAALEAIADSELCDDFREGTSEQTLLWPDSGIWCRSRPDRHAKDWRVLFDYKTTIGSASPSLWGRMLVSLGYDLQAALALRGVRRLNLCERPSVFVFIIQEMEPPYAVSFISPSPQFETLSQEKLAVAMSLWKGCLRTNHWPSYPAAVAYVDPPAYAAFWSQDLSPIQAEDLV